MSGLPYPPSPGYPSSNQGPPYPNQGYPSSGPYPPQGGLPYPTQPSYSSEPYIPFSGSTQTPYPPAPNPSFPPPTGQAPYPPTPGGSYGGQPPYPNAQSGFPYPDQVQSSHPYPGGHSYPEASAPYPQGDSSIPYPVQAPNEPYQPQDSCYNVEGNQMPLSKSLISKAISKGIKKAEDAIGSHIPKPSSAPTHFPSSIPSSFPSFPKSSPRKMNTVRNFSNQEYDDLKRECRRRGCLFEDPEFPASNRLLVDDKGGQRYIVSYFGRYQFEESSIEWLRPSEICERQGLQGPRMFVGKIDRFDINQGEIGNCWFLAALANLVENRKCFQRVVPSDQDFGRDYCGMFRFRFWRFGKWVEVVIDDRLPTRNGKLIYLRSVDKNEFWGALLEKAYAKLAGSYKALEGGLSIEAAVDFTGGIPEIMDLTNLKISPERLFYIMSKADARGAFMGCSLSNSSRAREAQQKGLQTRHAYSITKVVEVRSNRIGGLGGIPLIRLRNPHGNYKEWKGDWCDDDRNWRAIPSNLRQELGLTFEDDGEFYMSFRDFLKYFGELEFCHLHPENVDVEDNRRQFEVIHFNGQWQRGSTAGGCGNDGNRSFAMNPQFFVNLSDPDPYDDETLCPVVISVTQKQEQRKSEHAIGFKIFLCDQGMTSLDERFFSRNQSIARVDTFINLREVSKRIVLPEGRYCIVPCTFGRGEEGEFLLRVFIEKRWGSSEGGRVKPVTDTMDHGHHEYTPPSDDLAAMSFGGGGGGGEGTADVGEPTKSGKGMRRRAFGFALKVLEENVPGASKKLKKLKDIYNWATDRDSEFDLLKQIVKSVSK